MKKYSLVLGAVSIVALGCIGIALVATTVPPKVKVERLINVVKNPADYKNKTFAIKGKYGGWSTTYCGMVKTSKLGKKSKNDWILFDNTGCIYVGKIESGAKSELQYSPNDNADIGKKLWVEGRVILDSNGLPMLDLRKITDQQ